MEAVTEIHAYHGWGFDASFWVQLKKEIPHEIIFKAADRGYFRTPINPEFELNSTNRILFTHSFGLHLLAPSVIKKANQIVVFNGFEEFVSNDPLERRRELKVLNRMISQFEHHPKEVLTAFYVNCFHPQKNQISVPDNLNQQLLLDDLKELATSTVNVDDIRTGVIVITGMEDQIVPHQRTAQLANKLNADHFEKVEDAGHALAIVNSSDCWSFLSRVVPIFGQHAERNEPE